MIPLTGMVLVEPIRVPLSGGLHLGGEERFPTSGFIYEVGRRNTGDYRKGDFVVFEEHGIEQSSVLQDTFVIRLRDGEGDHYVRADIDIEPVVRETVEKYRRTKEDAKLYCEDLDRKKEGVQFLCSDVIDYGIGSYTESGYRIEYVHNLELHPVDTGLNHPTLMLVPEDQILFYISRGDLDAAPEPKPGRIIHV